MRLICNKSVCFSKPPCPPASFRENRGLWGGRGTMDLRVGVWQGSPPVLMETPLCHLPDTTARAGPLAVSVFQKRTNSEREPTTLDGLAVRVVVSRCVLLRWAHLQAWHPPGVPTLTRARRTEAEQLPRLQGEPTQPSGHPSF